MSVLLCLAVITPGCGGNGPLQDRAFGSVTFKGAPVPIGVIQFTPDASKGGSGEVGFAEVREGGYDTDVSGNGINSGAYIVTIDAYSLKNIDPDLKPNGDALVVGYEQKITIEAGQSSALNFELAQ
ncbi:hypothetical protein M4951_05510 [Blastopirellula sp. J2-11]|uniref:hypothetical protein n=1 Tax=Blastopirellula sp. J2-11 TaxID=2943192 RepID=UPI0021C96B5B|nr:hypothetical protein [Blastopirellula sp. J2-11]UUO07767.1 hypothetical protein M4951_05510 [Blastopirellula sp. J2-11]